MKLFLLYLSFSVIAAFSSPFSDIPDNHWVLLSLKNIDQAGLVDPSWKEIFSGNTSVTRFDVARALYLMETLATAEVLTELSSCDDFIRLKNEFSEELFILGIRSNALENELENTRNEMEKLGSELEEMDENEGESRFSLGGDTTLRFYDNNYRNTEADSIYNGNFFEERFGINLNARITENISTFIRFERFGYWNSAQNDWNAGRITGFNTDTDLMTSLGYAVFENPRRGIESITAGRHHFSLGTGLLINGVADGVSVKKESRRFFRGLSENGYIKLSSDNTSDQNDNDGLDLYFSSWIRPGEKRSYGFYRASGRDAFSEPGVSGLFDFFEPWRHVKRHHWTGAHMNLSPSEKFSWNWEFSRLRFDEKIDVNGDGEEEKGGNGYQIEFNWAPEENISLLTRYTRLGRWFFQPLSSGMTPIWDRDTYTDADGQILASAGFINDCSDLYSELTFSFDDQNAFTAGYEKIRDLQELDQGFAADDRIILTAVFSHQYSENSRFTVHFRRIGVEENNGSGMVADGNVHGSDGDGLGNISGSGILENGLNRNLSDVKILRIGLDVSF